MFTPSFEGARSLYSGPGRLEFSASFASQAAGFAVADYPGDESLEISKLGIHPEIVSCLANRGITKLFPIQVYICLILIIIYYCNFSHFTFV